MYALLFVGDGIKINQEQRPVFSYGFSFLFLFRKRHQDVLILNGVVLGDEIKINRDYLREYTGRRRD